MQEATSQIQSNRVRLRILEHSAVDHAASGQFEFALRSISGGADWAWFNHTGMFGLLHREPLGHHRVASHDVAARASIGSKNGNEATSPSRTHPGLQNGGSHPTGLALDVP